MTIEEAIALATEAHAGQVDRSGKPTIFHVLRVMLHVAEAGHPEEAQIAAVLHDVLEDSHLTKTHLRHYGASFSTLEALEALTRREGEPYKEYIERAVQNKTALIVKFWDNKDNLAPSRGDGLTEPLRRRYVRARTRISEELKKQ